MLKEDYIEGFAMTNCTGLIYQSKVKNHSNYRVCPIVCVSCKESSKRLL
ncbi:hypothetical protein [Rickettsia endosymbiont of Oedothorax gibbosus]|nr:hypothetical protein [Rickettsia endosymbiont of Oedothorax gibbosus]